MNPNKMELQTCLPATIFLIITLGNLLLSVEDGKLNVSLIPYIFMYAAVLQLLCAYGHTGLAWVLLISLAVLPVLLLILALVVVSVFREEIIKAQKHNENDEEPLLMK